MGTLNKNNELIQHKGEKALPAAMTERFSGHIINNGNLILTYTCYLGPLVRFSLISKFINLFLQSFNPRFLRVCLCWVLWYINYAVPYWIRLFTHLFLWQGFTIKLLTHPVRTFPLKKCRTFNPTENVSPKCLLLA